MYIKGVLKGSTESTESTESTLRVSPAFITGHSGDADWNSVKRGHFWGFLERLVTSLSYLR